MATNPNILLQPTTPNLGPQLQQGLQFLGQLRRDRNALKKADREKALATEFHTQIAPLIQQGNSDAARQAIANSAFDENEQSQLLNAVDNPNIFQAISQTTAKTLGIKPRGAVDPIEAEKLVIRREELAAREFADQERAAVQRETLSARKQADKQKIETQRAAIQAKLVAADLANDRKLANQAKIDTGKLNIKRIGELSQGAKGREEAIKKARQFRRSLSSGEATSGASRTFAGFIPGVFTDQAAFDEKFNAFAEVAARQQLKAAGEIRPTDADVEGMKRAMFGIGRTESVNIQLLDEFITDQQNLDEELQDLREAKSQNRLSVFTGSSPAATGLPQGTVDNGDGTFTLPTGETVRRK